MDRRRWILMFRFSGMPTGVDAHGVDADKVDAAGGVFKGMPVGSKFYER